MFGHKFGGNIRPSRTQDEYDNNKSSDAHDPDAGAAAAGENHGDGFHHHEIHEHEAGFHSKHTHPDGHETHADHMTAEEAADHMQQMMHSDGDESTEVDGSEEGADGADDSGEGDQIDAGSRYSQP